MHHPVPDICRAVLTEHLDPIPNLANSIPKPELVLPSVVLENVEEGWKLASTYLHARLQIPAEFRSV